MHARSLASALIAVALFIVAASAAPPVGPPPPFSIDVVPMDSSKLPGLHSFAIAQSSGGLWLIVGGRTNGLHLFVSSSNNGKTPPPNAFPTSQANTQIWVIDPKKRQAWSAPVSQLPKPVADQLSATNPLFYNVPPFLYVLGGYGLSSQTNPPQMTTFSSLLSINVDAMVEAVMGGLPLALAVGQANTYADCEGFTPQNQTGMTACMASLPACVPGPDFMQCSKAASAFCTKQVADQLTACIASVQSGQLAGVPIDGGLPYAQITGGGMARGPDGTFYLVFGQSYSGLYSVNDGDFGGKFLTQNYTEKIVALNIQTTPTLQAGLLTVVQQNSTDPQQQFHRRDLNVVPALDTDGKTQLIEALGGVFVAGQDTAYRQPIIINAPNPNSIGVKVDPFQQSLSQYNCGVVPLFDRTSSTMTHVLLGGISLSYVDAKTGKLKVDSGLPFVSAVSALSRSSQGSFYEHYRVAPITLGNDAALVGADARFVLDPSVSTAPNGVIYLDAIKQPTRVGWMYGGIQASSPNPGASNSGTTASQQLFEIWINPTPPPATYWATTVNAPVLVTGPNNDTSKVKQ